MDEIEQIAWERGCVCQHAKEQHTGPGARCQAPWCDCNPFDYVF